MARAVFKLGNRPPMYVVEKARQVVKMMTGNADFLNPVPSLAVVASQANALEKAFGKAIDGDKKKKTLMRVKFKELKSNMSLLIVFIQHKSGGDAVKILSTGTEVKSPKTPVGILPPPRNVRCKNGNHEREITLLYNGVPKRQSYYIEINHNPGNDNGWRFVDGGITGKLKFIAGGLESGRLYAFRVATVSSAGRGKWSEQAWHRAK